VVFKTITKEIALIGACYLTFALAKNFTDPSPILKAVTNGWSILRIESALALNWEPFVQQVIGKISMGALIATTYFYVVGMWLGLIAMAIFMFLRDRVAYIDLRRTFVISMILGAIVFALFPLAPPRFMPGLGMTDTVTMLGLDPAPNSDSAISYNRFAAMPSLLRMGSTYHDSNVQDRRPVVQNRGIRLPGTNVHCDHCNGEPLRARCGRRGDIASGGDTHQPMVESLRSTTKYFR